MPMIFKRNEDKINGQLLSFRKEMKVKFEEMGALEKKIDATLESSIKKILTEGAHAIGQRMVGHIEAASSRVFGANSDFHYLRGQIVIICTIAFLMTLAYWLGGAGVFDFDGGRSYFTMFLWLPAGGLAIVGGLVYTFTWYLDHEGRIGHYPSYGINIGLQIFILLILLLRVLF
jgi:hypothetical protein